MTLATLSIWLNLWRKLTSHYILFLFSKLTPLLNLPRKQRRQKWPGVTDFQITFINRKGLSLQTCMSFNVLLEIISQEEWCYRILLILIFLNSTLLCRLKYSTSTYLICMFLFFNISTKSEVFTFDMRNGTKAYNGKWSRFSTCSPGNEKWLLTRNGIHRRLKPSVLDVMKRTKRLDLSPSHTRASVSVWDTIHLISSPQVQRTTGRFTNCIFSSSKLFFKIRGSPLIYEWK